MSRPIGRAVSDGPPSAFRIGRQTRARGTPTDDHACQAALETRLLAYLAGPRRPLTIAALAAALDEDPLRVGRAILALHARGRLAVTCLPEDRFRLRPGGG